MEAAIAIGSRSELVRALEEARRGEVANAVLAERLNQDLAATRLEVQTLQDALTLSRATNVRLREEREELTLRVAELEAVRG